MGNGPCVRTGPYTNSGLERNDERGLAICSGYEQLQLVTGDLPERPDHQQPGSHGCNGDHAIHGNGHQQLELFGTGYRNGERSCNG